MNTKNRYIISITLFTIICFGLYLFDINMNEDYKYKSKNAYIDNCKINIKVNENNTYNVNEIIYRKNIDKDKNLYRIFSLKNQNNNRVKIEKFKSNSKMEYYMKKDKFIFEIFDSNTGEYNFNYLYNVGKDTKKNYDEFYYNLLGENFYEKVNNLNFKIEFSKKIDYKNVECYVLKNGKKDLSKIIYNINEKGIEGKLVKSLEPSEQIIIRAKLPDNYFIGAGYSYNILDVIYVIIPILGAVYCVILWFKNGKDKKLKKIITKYPPENLNVIELSALYKGRSEYLDILPELIHLANDGYIKIVETKFSFKIIKLKEYDGKNRGEELFLNKLFLDNKKGIIDEDDIIVKFKRNYGEITEYGDKFIEEKNTFHPTNSTKITLILTLILFINILLFIVPAIKYGMFTQSFNNTIGIDRINLLIIDSVVMFTGFMMYVISKDKMFILLDSIFLIFPCITFLAGTEKTQMLLYDPIYLIGFILGIIFCFVMSVCMKHMNRRTEEGNEMLTKIEGFKEFLKISTKEELEILLVENPNYFYDMLPYTTLFGMNKIWIKKFEDIKIKEVDWYEDKNGKRNINTFINSTYKKIENAFLYKPRRNNYM